MNSYSRSAFSTAGVIGLLTLIATGRDAATQEVKEKMETAVEKDIERLQGTWQRVSAVTGGFQLENEGASLVVRGNQIVSRKDIFVAYVAKISRIDSTTKPKQINLLTTDGPH